MKSTALRDYLESHAGYLSYSDELLNTCDGLPDEAQVKMLQMIMEFGISTPDDVSFMIKHVDKIDMMLNFMRDGKGWFYICNKIYRGQ